MSKAYYNQVKKIIKGKDLAELPAYNNFTWAKPKKDYEYVLVPLGLTLAKWHQLLLNKTNGLWHSSVWKDDLFTGKGWELHQVWAGDAPTEVNSYEEVGKSRLASAQVFIAQQWLRLERGLEPVDKKTWTMAAETTTQVAPVYVAGVRWDPRNRQMYLYDWGADLRGDYFGVRAEESGQISTLDSSSTSLPLELPKELTINGETWVRK